MQLLSPAPCCNPCCPSTLVNLTTLIEDAIEELGCNGCELVVTDTVAEMRAVSIYQAGWLYRTFGGAVINDGYGKEWYYDPLSFDIDSGLPDTTVILFDNKPIGEAGRLLQTL